MTNPEEDANLNDPAYQLLLARGWTWMTALSVMIFSLFHWPCATTLLTVKKETGSIKWTLISFFVPTFLGFLVCFVLTSLFRLFNLA